MQLSPSVFYFQVAALLFCFVFGTLQGWLHLRLKAFADSTATITGSFIGPPMSRCKCPVLPATLADHSA
jgi:hypothetical protein